MGTAELKAALQEAAVVVASIDAKVMDKLLRRARKHGIADDAAREMAKAWKRAAKKTKHWHHS